MSIRKIKGNTELTNVAEPQDKATYKTQMDKEEVRSIIRKYGIVRGLRMVKDAIANRKLNNK